MAKTVNKRKGRPPTSPKEREDEMINLAMKTAEEQLRNGTAPPSVVVHFLKLGSTRGMIENNMLEKKSELLTAQKEKLESDKRVEELYTKALDAMRLYGGQNDDEEPIDVF